MSEEAKTKPKPECEVVELNNLDNIKKTFDCNYPSHKDTISLLSVLDKLQLYRYKPKMISNTCNSTGILSFLSEDDLTDSLICAVEQIGYYFEEAAQIVFDFFITNGMPQSPSSNISTVGEHKCKEYFKKCKEYDFYNTNEIKPNITMTMDNKNQVTPYSNNTNEIKPNITMSIDNKHHWTSNHTERIDPNMNININATNVNCNPALTINCEKCEPCVCGACVCNPSYNQHVYIYQEKPKPKAYDPDTTCQMYKAWAIYCANQCFFHPGKPYCPYN